MNDLDTTQDTDRLFERAAQDILQQAKLRTLGNGGDAILPFILQAIRFGYQHAIKQLKQPQP